MPFNCAPFRGAQLLIHSNNCWTHIFSINVSYLTTILSFKKVPFKKIVLSRTNLIGPTSFLQFLLFNTSLNFGQLKHEENDWKSILLFLISSLSVGYISFFWFAKQSLKTGLMLHHPPIVSFHIYLSFWSIIALQFTSASVQVRAHTHIQAMKVLCVSTFLQGCLTNL